MYRKRPEAIIRPISRLFLGVGRGVRDNPRALDPTLRLDEKRTVSHPE